MHAPLWREIQRENFTSIEKLADFLLLDGEQRAAIIEKKDFPLNLPLRLASKITKQTLDDPILRQFLPTKEEFEKREGFSEDPVGDCHAALLPMYVKKYQGRALLIVTNACAMHCRFCFRQKYNYQAKHSDYSAELEMIQQDQTLREVILSGGDPLSISNLGLKHLLEQLERVPPSEKNTIPHPIPHWNSRKD